MLSHSFPLHAESITASLHVQWTVSLEPTQVDMSCQYQHLNSKACSDPHVCAHLKPCHPKEGSSALTAAIVQSDQYTVTSAGIKTRSSCMPHIINAQAA